MSLTDMESQVTFKINFSRHAKRRAKLYGIPLSEIKEVLENQKMVQGKQEMMVKILGQQYPVKIIFSLEADVLMVITNYPLKKEWQGYENTI